MNYAITTFIVVTSITYIFFYWKGNTYYDKGRAEISAEKSLKHFKFLYKILILSSVVITVLKSLHYQVPFDVLDNSYILQLVGLIFLGFGTLLFAVSILTLGKNYSPCYDLREPSDFVFNGIYNFIRHPIYTSNLLVLFGLFFYTGSVILLINFLITFYFYNTSAKLEEKELVKLFKNYKTYLEKVPRFIPFIY